MENSANHALITNGQLFLPEAEWPQGWVYIEGGRFKKLGAGQPPEDYLSAPTIDAGGRVILPGFIDLHAHGAVGYEVMDGDPQAILEMARFYACHGVTAFLATTWASSRVATMKALQAAAQVVGPVEGGASVLGVHLEGPYLNQEKLGAQDVRQIRTAERDEALEFLDTGVVKLIALAPEFEENLWLIEECARRGVAVSAGHTVAGVEQMQRAVDKGLTQVTHCYNAMQGLGHRDVGTVGAAMYIPEIFCELICDNIHVHPAAQKILIDVKTPDRVVLITDSMRGTGLADGEYRIDDRTVTIAGGKVTLPDGTIAGSVLTMDRALANAVEASVRPLSEAWVMSSLVPARAVGMDDHKGSLQPGKDADLVVLEKDYSVWMTVAQGRVVYSRENSGG